MMIIMRPGAPREQIDAVIAAVEGHKLTAHPIFGVEQTIIGAVGDGHYVLKEEFEAFPGVLEVQRISKPYKLASRQFHEADSVFKLDGFEIGGSAVPIIAGPCSVEGRTQIIETAIAVKEAGANALRGGVFKPRTSPYAFQGLAEEGLKILADVRERFGLAIVTEAVDEPALDLCERYADVIQIGTRNMQNFSLLKRAGQARKPILLKRGMSATLEEFLLAAEYIMSEGNYQVILCERGVRTFGSHSRFTPDLSVIPAAQRLSHLPIIFDPSHSTGNRDTVIPMSRAAIAVGADGILVDIHPYPERALCDGPQALLFDMFRGMVGQLRAIADIVNTHSSVHNLAA